MSDANIATIASLALAIVLVGIFSRRLRVILLVAVVGTVVWAVQSGGCIEQGATMLASLSNEIRGQLGDAINPDVARAIIRDMLERVSG